jgi:hypothetical protein
MDFVKFWGPVRKVFGTSQYDLGHERHDLEAYMIIINVNNI